MGKKKCQNYYSWCFFPKHWEFSHQAQEQCVNAEQQSTKFSTAEVKENKVPAAELTALEQQSTEKPVSSKLGTIILPVFSSARSPKQGFSDCIREVSQMPTVFLYGEITDHKIKLISSR